jgi:DnaJ family protein C protein 7
VSERAQASLRLRLYEEALADCDLALAAREDHKRAYYVAGSCLIALGRPNEAAERLAFLLRMDPNDETTKKHHEKAVFETRKLARPKYYEVLGVASVASVPEIKQAYKARCMQWHPDRHAASTDEEKALAERNFKALGEALEIMEDPMKRKLYDEGYDKEAIAERAEAARRAAHRGGNGCGGGGGGCC